MASWRPSSMSFGHLPGAFLEIFFWFQKATLGSRLPLNPPHRPELPLNPSWRLGGLAACPLAFSVLHCHGVSPSGGCGFARSFLAQEPRFGAGQVAQKSPHFLWVSEVTLGTFSPPFLRLLRPSLPWCFPVRGLWFCAVFPRPRTAFWSGTSSSEISSFSMGFRSYVRHFFAAFFAPSPSFTAKLIVSTEDLVKVFKH